MSYILDALKKSEQERQRGTVPDLLTIQEELLQPSRRRFPWRYVAGAAIVLGAGASAWLLLPLKSSGPVVPVVHQEQKSVMLTVAPQDRDMPVSAPSAAMPGKKAEETRLPAGGDNGDMGRIRREVLPERPSSGMAHPGPAPQETEKPLLPTQQAALPPADPDRVYRLKELPSALQKGLPSFSLSAFMYSSDPELRMVRINEKMMREGQELAAGIRLQEITTDGVILVSQGYRFFIAMK
jgi:general secretion pathway protein B